MKTFKYFLISIVIILTISIYLTLTFQGAPENDTPDGVEVSLNKLEDVVETVGKIGIIENAEISKVTIHDFNWESGITTVFSITSTNISVKDTTHVPRAGMPAPQNYKLSQPQQTKLQEVLKGITKIHTGSYKERDTYDGVSITFNFMLTNKKLATTHLNNVKIQSYARLTKFISEVTKTKIHYHDYEMVLLD